MEMFSVNFKVMKNLLKEMRSYSIDLPCRVKSTFTNVLYILFSIQKPNRHSDSEYEISCKG